MKKASLLLTALLVIAIVICARVSVYADDNLGALTGQDEKPHGRYRTVGCGGTAFNYWKNYCCPNQNYDNCPDAGNCSSSLIIGCE